MKNIKKLVFAAIFATCIAPLSAQAACNGEYGCTTKTTTHKAKVYEHSSYSVGTRRVGMVGYHPYPLVARSIDSSTIRSNRNGTVTRTDTTTTTGDQDGPYTYTSGGGTYYTSTGQKYYENGDLNIIVRNTGSFNN